MMIFAFWGQSWKIGDDSLVVSMSSEIWIQTEVAIGKLGKWNLHDVTPTLRYEIVHLWVIKDYTYWELSDADIFLKPMKSKELYK